MLINKKYDRGVQDIERKMKRKLQASRHVKKKRKRKEKELRRRYEERKQKNTPDGSFNQTMVPMREVLRIDEKVSFVCY